MNLPAIVAIAIFLVTYILLATEKVHKTKAVLAGAVLMILLRIVSQRTALHGDEAAGIEGVDWNTIMLLIGMMIVFFRYKGIFSGGVAFSILLGNMLAPSLDLWIKRFSKPKPKPVHAPAQAAGGKG